MAEFARAQGVSVVGREDLHRPWDALICSDAATCHELVDRCPGAVRIYVVHSVDYLLQAPPQLGDRCQAVVVLNDRVRRAVEARGWHAPVVRLRQPIDLRRFDGIGSGCSPARTVLVLSNELKSSRIRVKLIESACRANGLDVKWAGGEGNRLPAPELAIAGADVVVGLGRCVLEAMAAGRAAYVYGQVGGDGWVTPESYRAMESDGFAGTSASSVMVGAARLAEDLASWHEEMGQLNRDLAHAHHTAREHAVALVNLARELDAPVPVEPSLGEEFAHLIRLQWHAEARAVANLQEVDRLNLLLSESQGTLRAVAGELEALRSRRRFRLGSRIASLLDRLRRRLGRSR